MQVISMRWIAKMKETKKYSKMSGIALIVWEFLIRDIVECKTVYRGEHGRFNSPPTYREKFKNVGQPCQLFRAASYLHNLKYVT